MTKRRLERDIETLSDEVLIELEPMERLRYLLEAFARDEDRWVERLQETCPAADVPSVVMAGNLALLWAYEAVYDLHTSALQFNLLKTTQEAWRVIDHHRDESPSDERLAQAADRADDIRVQFISLYIAYHSYRRFATEVLGIDLKTWVDFHKNGSAVLEAAEAVLENPTQESLAAEWLAEEEPMDIDVPADEALDAHAERRYETRVAIWNEVFTPRARGSGR